MVVNLRTIATEYLKPPLGEPVKGKNKTTTKLWLEKFYQKTTNLPEPFLHELVERGEASRCKSPMSRITPWNSDLQNCYVDFIFGLNNSALRNSL
ncbi:hypothetical protein Peur_042734 [Populus x canadensis]